MKKLVVIWVILLGPLNGLSFAIETAPRISDREIIEKLTCLEEGQKGF